MDQATQIVQSINSLLWGVYCLIPLLVGTGIYFTFKLRLVQIRRFTQAVHYVFGDLQFFGKSAGKDGMCDINDREFKRTEKVEDVLNIGDMTWVKVTEIDDRGRVNLSRKEALKERGEA